MYYFNDLNFALNLKICMIFQPSTTFWVNQLYIVCHLKFLLLIFMIFLEFNLKPQQTQSWWKKTTFIDVKCLDQWFSTFFLVIFVAQNILWLNTFLWWKKNYETGWVSKKIEGFSIIHVQQNAKKVKHFILRVLRTF